jgi:hypothetical protein
MDKEELFLRIFEELETKTLDGYGIIRSSALVRQLLLDDHALAHAVNKFRIKLRFSIPDRELPNGDDSPVAHMIFLSNSNPSKLVRIDAFLAAKFLFAVGKSYTNREIIKLCANVYGGVHTGKPDEKEAILVQVDRWTSEAEPGFAALRLSSMGVMAGIVPIVVEGLRPLAEALKAERKGE